MRATCVQWCGLVECYVHVVVLRAEQRGNHFMGDVLLCTGKSHVELSEYEVIDCNPILIWLEATSI